jgi:serine/threonine protein phosphatase PrpC
MEDRICMEQIRNKKGELTALFFAVMDGHGGPEASEHVSQTLWQTLLVRFEISIHD